MADLNTGTILTDRFTQPILDGALMANRRHIDVIDNDQTAQVAQTQLTGNLIGRFQVGVKRRLFDVTAACRTG